jgi:hypothetical protein
MTMAMKNPPRRTTIKGQKHLLAYITPDEAKLLKAMGGSGELHNGVPAFVPGFGSEKSDGAERDKEAAADRDRPGPSGPSKDKDKDKDKYKGVKPTGISGGQATAMFGDAALAGAINTAEAESMTGIDGEKPKLNLSADVLRNILKQTALKNYVGSGTPKASFTPGVLTELMKRAKRAEQAKTLFGAVSPFQTAFKNILGYKPSGTYDDLTKLMNMPGSYVTSGTFLDPSNMMFAPTGGTGAFGMPAGVSQGYFGTIGYTGMPNPDYTGPFENLVGGYKGVDRGGDGIVPTQTNPVTGEQQCPDGYMFDEDLQACRLSVGLPGGDDASGFGELGAATGDLFGRMGLLDIAPTGLGMFKQSYGAGFGSPSEFDTANMAFKQSAGVQRPYPGYTLLS